MQMNGILPAVSYLLEKIGGRFYEVNQDLFLVLNNGEIYNAINGQKIKITSIPEWEVLGGDKNDRNNKRTF